MSVMDGLLSDPARRTLTYLTDWWRLYPQDWERLNEMDREEIHAERRRLHDEINAATEGDLARLIGCRDCIGWTIVVGFAVGANSKPGGTTGRPDAG